jgi:hypothetical protein
MGFAVKDERHGRKSHWHQKCPSFPHNKPPSNILDAFNTVSANCQPQNFHPLLAYYTALQVHTKCQMPKYAKKCSKISNMQADTKKMPSTDENIKPPKFQL